MWEALLASAAANKAIAAGVGLSVIVGSAGAIEATGVGAAVRDIVHEAPASEPLDEESSVVLVEDEQESLLEEIEEPADEGNGGEHYTVAAEDAPGNLVWHERDGAFHLRGVIVDEDGLAIRTAAPDGETVDLAIDESVELSVPGGPGADDEPALEDYVGYLVRATGECSVEALASIESDGEEQSNEGELVEAVPADASDCTVTEIRVLGRAGQADGDELQATGELTLEDDGHGGPPEGRGKPDHAGSPQNDEQESLD